MDKIAAKLWECIRFAWKFSLSDRSRFYWKKPQEQNALRILLNKLSQLKLPGSLVSQFITVRDFLLKMKGKILYPNS